MADGLDEDGRISGEDRDLGRRGAGVDLDDEVSLPVEVSGLVDEADGVVYLTVRGYKVLEDDSWLEE